MTTTTKTTAATNPAPGGFRPGDRVKGYGGRVPACPFPCNMGTVVPAAAGPGAAAPGAAAGVAVRWDTGQTLAHDPGELKRL